MILNLDRRTITQSRCRAIAPPLISRLHARHGAPWCRVEREIFDDAPADGASIRAAGRRAGRSPAQARRQFARICAALGDQAY